MANGQECGDGESGKIENQDSDGDPLAVVDSHCCDGGRRSGGSRDVNKTSCWAVGDTITAMR